MILLLDVGNTRIKWAWLEYLEIAPSGAVAHDASHRSWQAEIEADGHRPSRIVVANVAGPAFAAALTLWSRDHYAVEPEFVVPAPRLLGVVNGYRRPAALGVDRWLGLIAAWRSAARATLIVNSGTALTVDAIDGTGRHHGGLIVPGVQMLADARAAWATDERLLAGRALAGLPPDPVPFTLAALAERAAAQFAHAAGAEPRLLLTGGDAALLASHLSRPAEIVPELVL
ncbi:MAG: type III pantothenate kinase, partial [Proteobacteria bacterium]|nr:type III pantothenate kinase [Pseudomonadota bacterium]